MLQLTYDEQGDISVIKSAELSLGQWEAEKKQDGRALKRVFPLLSNGAFPLHGTARYGTVRFTFGVFSTGYCTWYLILFYGAFPLHGMVRFGTARYGTVRLSSGRFAFPPQFSTAIEWAGLFTRRYNCAASTAVTSS